MGLAVAIVLVHQIDLDVPQVRPLAQVILAHQAVEVDGGGGAGIGLVVRDLRDAGEVVTHLGEHPGGLLQAGPLGHVEHHLELGLVVEGQHLEDDDLGGHQPQGARDQDQDARQQQPAVEVAPGPEQEGAYDPVEEALHPAAAGLVVTMPMPARPRLGLGRVALAQHEVGHPGGEDEGDHQRDQHPGGGVDGDGGHVGPHEPGDEGHGQQGGDDGEGGQYGRPADLIHGTRHQVQQAAPWTGPCAGGCSPPPRWRRPPGCRWRRSGQRARRD